MSTAMYKNLTVEPGSFCYIPLYDVRDLLSTLFQ